MGNTNFAVTPFMLPAQIHRQHGFIDEQVQMVELFGGEPDLNEAHDEVEAFALRAPGNTGVRVAGQGFGHAG
jgi:hypothetical protein